MKKSLASSLVKELEHSERWHRDRQKAIMKLDELKAKEANSIKTKWTERGCVFTRCIPR